MKTCYDILKNMVLTERSAEQVEDRKYFFRVALTSNKIEIKNSVEEIYKVKVQWVNTSVVVGKLKRVRGEQGRTPSWKKAIVTLKEGQKIEVA